MIRAALLIGLVAQPAMAEVDLPSQLICDFVGICDPAGECTAYDPPQPVFTLLRTEQEWLWDIGAEWQGFPVLMADNTDDALTEHRADPHLGLALISNGTTTDGLIILDGHGLPSFDDAPLDANAMRHHCREPDERVSS